MNDETRKRLFDIICDKQLISEKEFHILNKAIANCRFVNHKETPRITNMDSMYCECQLPDYSNTSVTHCGRCNKQIRKFMPNLTKENTKWNRLCKDHSKTLMVCPCWIVEKDECEVCVA